MAGWRQRLVRITNKALAQADADYPQRRSGPVPIVVTSVLVIVGETGEQDMILPGAIDAQVTPGVAFALKPELGQQPD